MSLHVFANIATHYGTAANNRAETEGNITTLQKLIWQQSRDPSLPGVTSYSGREAGLVTESEKPGGAE